jgi:Uma2 family endonuclease
MSLPLSSTNVDVIPEVSHRGIPVRRGVDVADYLALEQTSRVKHELKDGDVFMMAGASERHNRIAGKLYARLLAAEVSPCRTYFADMKLKLEDDTIYYPDIMVVCDETDDHPYYKTRPCLLVEVLSESTAAIDRGEKALAYSQLPSLKAYVLISQTSQHAEIYRPNAQGWLLEYVSDVLTLPCLDIAVNLTDIYA